MRRLVLLATLAALAGSVGCGSSAGSAATTTTTRSPASAPKPARTLVVGTAANGRTIRVRRGEHVVVRLEMLTWAFGPVTGDALRPVGPPHRHVQVNGCQVTIGCGSVELRLTAVRPGRSVVNARRGLCGEDYRCSPAQRTFALVVLVS